MATKTEGTTNLDIRRAESIEQAVYMTAGAASACWDNLEEAGVFASDRAKEAAEDLLAYIEEHFVPRKLRG